MSRQPSPTTTTLIFVDSYMSTRKHRSQDKALRAREDLVRRAPGLTDSEKILWIEIARGWAWDDKSCFPSQESLADALGWSTRKVRRQIASLVSHCLLRVKRSGKCHTNIYELPERIPESICSPARLINKTLKDTFEVVSASGDRTTLSAGRTRNRTDSAAGTGQDCPISEDNSDLSDRTVLSSEDELPEDEPQEEDENTEGMRVPEHSQPDTAESHAPEDNQVEDEGSDEEPEIGSGDELTELAREAPAAPSGRKIAPRTGHRNRAADKSFCAGAGRIGASASAPDTEFVTAKPMLPETPDQIHSLLNAEIKEKYGAAAAGSTITSLMVKQRHAVQKTIVEKYNPEVVLAMVRVLVWDWEIARECCWPNAKEVAYPDITHLLKYRIPLSGATTKGFPYRERRRGTHGTYASRYLENSGDTREPNPF